MKHSTEICSVFWRSLPSKSFHFSIVDLIYSHPINNDCSLTFKRIFSKFVPRSDIRIGTVFLRNALLVRTRISFMLRRKDTTLRYIHDFSVLSVFQKNKRLVLSFSQQGNRSLTGICQAFALSHQEATKS